MRPIDADAIKLEKGFFEKVDNVPKFYEWLGKIPTIDAVPMVHGEWEETDDRWGIGKWRCSVCEKHSELHSDYCPNCGAKMDGEK